MKAVTEVIERSVASLKPYARNARTHSKKQIKQIASSIDRFERMTDSQESVTYFAEKHSKARDPRRKSFWRDEWHYEQRLFDLFNDSLPKKHKRKLVNRSYAEDASREGKTLDEFRRNRKLRNEFVS